MGELPPNRPNLNAVQQEAAPFHLLWYTGKWPRALSALRHANFRYFWFGQLISLIGTWMQNTAQSWLVYELALNAYGKTNAAFYVGLIGALGSAPMFMLILFAGVAADRYNRRHILIATQTFLGLLAAGLAFLYGTGHLRLWHVAVFAALSGLVMAFDMPTRQAFVKDMASPKDLLNAIALNSSIFNLARIIGPGVAGVLMGIKAIGIAGVLYFNAATYLAVIAGLILIRYQPAALLEAAGSVWGRLAEGFRYAYQHRVIRLILIVMAIYSVFAFSYAVLMPVFANQVLQQAERGYGLLMASTGFGAFVGAIFLASTAHRARKGRMLLAGGLICCLALIFFSLSKSFFLSMALVPFIGAGLVVTSASVNSMVQEIVPDNLRGRVVAIWAFIFAGFSPVGALYAGAVARVITAPGAVLVGGLICLLMLVLISVTAGWLWNLE